MPTAIKAPPTSSSRCGVVRTLLERIVSSKSETIKNKPVTTKGIPTVNADICTTTGNLFQNRFIPSPRSNHQACRAYHCYNTFDTDSFVTFSI